MTPRDKAQNVSRETSGVLDFLFPSANDGTMTQPDRGDRRARSILDRLRPPLSPAQTGEPRDAAQPKDTAQPEDAVKPLHGGPTHNLASGGATDNTVTSIQDTELRLNSEEAALAASSTIEPGQSDNGDSLSTFPASDLSPANDVGGAAPITIDVASVHDTAGSLEPPVPPDAAPAEPLLAVPPDLDRLVASLDAPNPAESDPATGPGGGVDEYGRPLHPSSLSHPLPRRIAVANQKGGVGKTTTTVSVGASLAELGYRVLVVDLDPQGNATTGLGVNARSLESSIYDVLLHDVPIDDVVEPTSMRNLFVVPATIDLAGAEIELVPVFSRELRLKRAIDSIATDFDFVLVDCPPSLGLLTVNAMAAAEEVLVPIQCEYYALEGLGQLLRNVNLVKANLNASLDVSVIVLTMYDARTRLAEQVANEVRDHFGARVCRSIIPRTVRLSEAPSFGRPITTFDPSSRGAIAYRELAKEVSGGAEKRAG